MNMGIRLSRPGDLETLRAISAEARNRYRSIPALAFVADAPPLDPRRFDACRVLVAQDDARSRLLGFAMSRAIDGLLYLDNISVATAAAGQDVGSRLLAEIQDHARTLVAPAIILTTFAQPKWNGPWFRRKGFVTMPENRIGEGLRAILDRQALSFDPATRETLWRVFDKPFEALRIAASAASSRS